MSGEQHHGEHEQQQEQQQQQRLPGQPRGSQHQPAVIRGHPVHDHNDHDHCHADWSAHRHSSGYEAIFVSGV